MRRPHRRASASRSSGHRDNRNRWCGLAVACADYVLHGRFRARRAWSRAPPPWRPTMKTSLALLLALAPALVFAQEAQPAGGEAAAHTMMKASEIKWGPGPAA